MDKQIQTFQKIEHTQLSQSRIPQLNRHYGLTLPIGALSNGEPKYILGPHYWVFLITLLVTSVIFSIMGYNIAAQAQTHKIQISIGIICVMAFYIYSYIKVGFSNPGIASSDIQLSQQQKNNLRHCRPCKIIRPLGTVHCYNCDVCITGYDHHCPWVGKCVGKNNMCDFKLFIFSIILALSTFGFCIYLSGNSSRKIEKITN